MEDTIQEFFKNWSDAIQAIMIIILVSTTIWYARATKKMADTMKKEHSLKTVPMLMIDRDIIRTMVTANTMQIKFLYKNIGKVPIIYNTELVELNKKSILPDTPDTILLPNQQGSLYSKWYKQDNDIISGGDGLKGTVKVIWWAYNIPNKKYYFYREFYFDKGLNTFIEKEIYGELN